MRMRALLEHPDSAPTVRYALAGATVGAVYLATPLALRSGLGVPIEAAIPFAYVVAVCLHFNLQRHFVFRHVPAFALSTRDQIARYVMIGAIQYPTAAISIAVLPGALGVSEPLVWVITTVAISAAGFLLLRAHVFHPADERPARLS
jgi:putative flippase GtrA